MNKYGKIIGLFVMVLGPLLVSSYEVLVGIDLWPIGLMVLCVGILIMAWNRGFEKYVWPTFVVGTGSIFVGYCSYGRVKAELLAVGIMMQVIAFYWLANKKAKKNKELLKDG